MSPSLRQWQGIAALVSAASAATPDVKISIDWEGPRTRFAKPWEESVGSGHAALTLRSDWQQHMSMARRDLGFKRARFHGILDDDMSTSLGPGMNSYVNVDSWADFMVERDMSGIVELGFMPRWLARKHSGLHSFQCEHTLNHYSACVDPPSNFTQWGEVVGSLVTHLVERYGLDEVANRWMFEVWNEPNLNGQGDPLETPPPGFEGGGDWFGTGLEYFELYAYAARAIKAVSPRIRVGGPATTMGANLWVRHFKEWCENNSVPLDFISTHGYAGGDRGVNRVGNMLTAWKAAKEAAGNLPHMVTEWGGTWRHGSTVIGGGGTGGPDQIGNATAGRSHDDHTAAAFVVAMADKAQGLADVMSYWCVSDIFEEFGFPVANSSFHGNFGLINVYGVPKPAYRAFQLLREMGDQRLPTDVSGNSSCAGTVGAIATRPADEYGIVTIIFYNQASTEDKVPSSCVVEAEVRNYAFVRFGGTIRRIDDAHANPISRWIDLGLPQYPSKKQNDEMRKASEMVLEPLNGEDAGFGIKFSLEIPANGVASVQLPLSMSGGAVVV